jgi:hypothetical protein
MKSLRAAAMTLIALLFLSSPAFSQTNATLGGTVSDPSGALVPGASIKATNQATGIVTTVISNDAGAYNFASLPPGRYNVVADLPGFRSQTYSDVQLGNAAQARLNFTLTLASVAQSVDVTMTAQNLITSSSSSVGEVLPQQQIQDLPLVSNNILDLIGVMAGVLMTNSPVFGAEATNFAGVSARDINVQRDGISINNQRWPNGLDSPTRMNPDLVGEIKLILAPVDAEMGRGNGQVQIQTRSGTNKYSGAAVWNVQNSALDANTWVNNRNQTPNNLGIVRATQPPWRNFHEYNLAFGGPIKRNKTFFYALWDQQFILTRAITNPTVLTDCARLGIFRYFDSGLDANGAQIPSWNNGHARTLTVATGATPTIAVVDVNGNPKAPATNPNGTPFTGSLRYLSVFGPLTVAPTRNDCSDAQIGSDLVPTGATTRWDARRTQVDRTGFMTKLLGLMPRANAFDNPGNAGGGDGLNTANHQWLRRAKGADNLFGVGQDNNRRQINVKLDHNFSANHKLNGSYSYEIDTSDDAALPAWPSGYPGQDIRKPQVLSVGFISTISASLLNEARFGLSRTGANTGGAVNRADVGEEVLAMFPQVGGQTVLVGPNFGFGSLAFGSGLQGLSYSSQEVSPRWTYGDTVSWTRGVHAFKFGGEFRMSSTKSTLGGSVQTGANRPTATIGNTAVAPVTGIGRPGLAGTQGTGNQQIAENMLTWLSGSLSGLAQARFINNLSGTWNDFATDPLKIRDIAQNEIGTFFKDDWKVSRNLTLNLGVRWDYYGVPWERNGLTTGLKDGGHSLFGLSGRSFNDWMKPGVRGELTELIYVGPNSPNPDQKIYQRDMNNFGPAIGFAWQVPWFGQGKTTVRGGYQIQFLGGGRGFILDTAIGNPPGSSNTATCITCAASYFSLETLVANPSLVPVQPTFLPKAEGNVVPVTDRTGLLNAFDPSYLSPYVQNLTLSVTRNLTSKVTLDLRYIGTLSRKLWSNMDLNAPNFLYNGLKEAFDAARRGEESTLLNDMFAGLNIAGTGCATNTGVSTPCGPVGTTPTGGVLQTGAMHLRAAAASGIRTNLANGNYAALASTLNTLTNAGATNNGNNPTLSGSVLRNSGRFPENFIKTNPQFNTAVLETNLGHANYHSVQTQVSMRPTAGLSLQGTYTFSRNLGQTPGGGANGTGGLFTDPADRMADYTLLPSHRQHALVTYGTFELPVGPNKLLFSNASGIWARLAEGWQASWVANLASGSPANVSAQSMLYALGVPDIVGPFDIKNLNYLWKEGNLSGNIFADANGASIYSRVRDPQCSNPSYSLKYPDTLASGAPNPIAAFDPESLCTLNAVSNASGQVLLQAPLPGKRGTFGQNRFENVGSWTADMAIQKRLRISESKSMTFRVDATNVFNHPTPGQGGLFAPAVGASDLSLQGATPFGSVNSKSGQRRFQLKARLDF